MKTLRRSFDHFVDQVWFPKGLIFGSIGFEFEFPKVPFWEPSALDITFQGFCYGLLRM